MWWWGEVLLGVVFWALVIYVAAKFIKKLFGGQRTSDLEARLTRLEQRWAELEERLVKWEGGVQVPPTLETSERSSPKAPSPPSRQTVVSPPATDQESVEVQVAGRWFQYVAIAAILFGTGYFLKLAFENNWIGPMGRVMLGWIAGVAFLVVGHLWAPRFKGYALGLMGGGLGLVYLSTYAAFQWYRLVADLLAFGLMVLTTATGVGLAVVQVSQPLAAFAVLGGFLTPALLSTGVDRQVGLMSYLLLLNAGVLAVSLFQKWRLIRYGSWVATVWYCWGWWHQFYHPDKLWITLGFHTAFFLMFAAIAAGHDLLRRTDTDLLDAGFSMANGLLYFFSTYELLMYHGFGRVYRPLAALLAVALAAFYGWQATFAIRNREGVHPPYLAMMLLGLGVTFLTVAIPIQWEGRWITVAWAVEAVALMWAGLKAHHRGTRVVAIGVLALVVFRLLVFDGWASVKLTVWNPRLLPFGTGVGSFALIAWLLRRHAQGLPPAEVKWSVWLGLVGNLIVLWYLSLETADFWNRRREIGDIWNAKQVSLSLLWLVYASGVMVVGMLRKVQALRLLAIVTFGITILKVFLFDLSGLHGGYRVLSLIGLGVILLVVSYLYQRNKAKFTQLVKGGDVP